MSRNGRGQRRRVVRVYKDYHFGFWGFVLPLILLILIGLIAGALWLGGGRINKRNSNAQSETATAVTEQAEPNASETEEETTAETQAEESGEEETEG